MLLPPKKNFVFLNQSKTYLIYFFSKQDYMMYNCQLVMLDDLNDNITGYFITIALFLFEGIKSLDVSKVAL